MVVMGMGYVPRPAYQIKPAHGAVKKSPCWELDMDAARSMFTVTHHSCMEQYQRLRQTEDPRTGGMSLG